MAELVYSVFPTELGWIGLLGSNRGLRRLVLPQPSGREALRLLIDDPTKALNNDLTYLGLCYRLRDYFAGKPVDFSTEKVDFAGASSFRKTVWHALRDIPYGETRTYKWLAEKVSRPCAARAVGQALAANPIPIIIPCHRIVAVSGLGGYAGGLALKKKLLDLEAASPLPPDTGSTQGRR